jgi:hypothetical protein
LGGRASLAGDHGMLFVFKDKDKYGFWMKGMNFPLDFVWLDGETVVDITPNVPTWTGLDNPPPIYPNQPVNMVLEVNAGVTSDVGLKIGDKMTLPKNLAK